jgi:hypothetical protein
MAYIGKTPVIGNFQICDAITVVDAQAAYTMQVGGVDVSPETANHMLVSLNGILQAPTSSFTVSGSTITFASALETGDVIDFIQILGNVLDLGVPSDNTVTTAKLSDSSVTTAKLNDASVSLAKLTATGTKDATTFLRGDNTFAEAGGGILTAFNGEEDLASTTSSTNTSYIDVGSDIVITPTATGDKVWVNVRFEGSIGGGNGNYKVVRTIGVTSTDVFSWSISPSTTRTYDKWYQDSPSTTSAITYKLQMQSVDGGAGHTIYIADDAFVRWMCLATTV